MKAEEAFCAFCANTNLLFYAFIIIVGAVIADGYPEQVTELKTIGGLN